MDKSPGALRRPLFTKGVFQGALQKKQTGETFMQKNNPALRDLSRKLRKEMTREERHLWYDFLRYYPVRFVRQHPISNYIVDFYCAKAHLAVELDGSQHYEPETIKNDNRRTIDLRSLGIEVIRFPNNAVNKQFEGVCNQIDLCVQARLKGKPLPKLEFEYIP